jgi:hypothetical protein
MPRGPVLTVAPFRNDSLEVVRAHGLKQGFAVIERLR